MRPYPLLAAALLLALPAQANITLPRLLADHLVLQQKSRVALWGWAAPGEVVTITASWSRKRVQTTANAQGSWLGRVPTGKAGGPYTLTFEGRNKLTVQDVLLGEVWLCGGQSNMGFPISRRPNSGSYSGVLNEAEVKPQARYPQIQMFTVKNLTADTPQPDVPGGSWILCSSETVGSFRPWPTFSPRKCTSTPRCPSG
ncbi:hypothetical protein [Hymenobacter sp. CRA2]|uniref:hypothetical protein n=1 Tax=Hymenobacter sp. CRA2 TaxID=1955620 RepID=UPI001C379099|nr:hypothetical protein [Hymenobacter sp. CRA2]